MNLEKIALWLNAFVVIAASTFAGCYYATGFKWLGWFHQFVGWGFLFIMIKFIINNVERLKK